ncbi:HAMP domain-containing histidine kinase [Planctomycetota bacterium]|nr:HAMP domain-containing histidine kinase [Planctomycetota bacterium]
MNPNDSQPQTPQTVTPVTAGNTSARPDIQSIEQLLEHLNSLESHIKGLQEGLAHSHRLVTLGTITSIIAHEFNNLLTPIISYTQLAMLNPEDVALAQKANAKSHEAASRAAHIANSMLNFARQEDESARTAELNEVIESTLACMARKPEKDNIDLQVRVPDRDGSGVRVLINPTHLQQVLLNLILNARKALCSLGKRGGRININATTLNQSVVIEVADNGPGIPSKILENLFDAFVTSPTSGKSCDRNELSNGAGVQSAHENDANDTGENGVIVGRDACMGGDDQAAVGHGAGAKGTGLGLYICRQLIEQAAGTIAVTSEEGQGATFTITLPLAVEILG